MCQNRNQYQEGRVGISNLIYRGHFYVVIWGERFLFAVVILVELLLSFMSSIVYTWFDQTKKFTNINIQRLKYDFIVSISFLYTSISNNLNSVVILICRQNFHDHINLLRWDVWTHITSLTPTLFTKVPVPSHESEQLCICL